MLGHRLISITTALATATLALSACGGESKDTAKTATSVAPSAATPSTAAPVLTIADPWVKTAAKGMSAAFGTLVNTTGSDITIVSGSTPASSMVELHEVVGTGGEMKMQPKNGGFVVPAGGKLELKPGGFHIMLMKVTKSIKPGDQVAFTLTLKDGTKIEFTALGKSFNGANETYKPGH